MPPPARARWTLQTLEDRRELPWADAITMAWQRITALPAPD
jgi:hypothetical protein